jgi:hypothetical protein
MAVFAEARYDNHYFFVRGNFDGVGSDSAKYTGSLQDGTPITMSTRERVYTGEMDAGYKLVNQSTATLSPSRYWIPRLDKGCRCST